MSRAEELADEINDVITAWLKKHNDLIRDAHSDAAWNAVEDQLNAYLTRAGFTPKMMREAEVSLRERIEEAYLKIYPPGGGFRAPGEPFPEG